MNVFKSPENSQGSVISIQAYQDYSPAIRTECPAWDKSFGTHISLTPEMGRWLIEKLQELFPERRVSNFSRRAGMPDRRVLQRTERRGSK